MKTRNGLISIAAAMGMLILVCGPERAHAQAPSQPSSGMIANPDHSQTTGALGGGDADRKLNEFIDKTQILARKKPTEKSDAEARERAAALTKALHISCEVTGAEQVGTAKSLFNGKTVNTTLYEVACANSMGYFLVWQDPAPPTATSCIAADASHQASLDKGIKSDLFCQLPGNQDIKAMAGNIMSNTGTKCQVRDLRWLGLSETSHAEYTEVACADNQGYLIKSPLPGTEAQTAVLTCADAGKTGVPCQMTVAKAEAKPDAKPNMQNLLDALTQKGMKCQRDEIRYIGQENARKRYVVEYLCKPNAVGMVAFIPLLDNTNPFESIDCTAAVARGVTCKLQKH